MARVNVPGIVRAYLAQEIGPTEGPAQEFECGYCTRCCETMGKEVILTLPEAHRLSQHFGQTMAETFRDKLHAYGVPLVLHKMFGSLPEEGAPIAIQLQMPCTFLHESHRENRRNNCTINDFKPNMCLEVPYCFYDPKAFSSRGLDGMQVSLESVVDYSCMQNRFVSEEEVLKEKAAEDLFGREFRYTLKTLYTPRIFMPKGAMDQIVAFVKSNMQSEWYRTAAEGIRRTARFANSTYPLQINIFMKVLAGKIDEIFKERVIRKLTELQQDPEVMEKIGRYNREYFSIRQGQIPAHIKFIRDQPQKRRINGR